MSSLDADLDLALDATRRAGALVLRWFRQDPEVRHKEPGFGQPVTDADIAADRFLHETLLGARPDYGWLSEETTDRPARLDRRRVWVVDPIDGTRSFIAGRPEFSISVGLVEDGRPVVGVVMNPATDEVYWAVRGSGAWGGNASGGPAERLAVRGDVAGERTLLASRSDLRHGIIAPILEALGPVWRAEGLGSTAWKMASVAAGKADAFVATGPRSEWDVCAGSLLLELAGGHATDSRGRPFHFNRERTGYRGAVATGGPFHEALIGAIAAGSG